MCNSDTGVKPFFGFGICDIPCLGSKFCGDFLKV